MPSKNLILAGTFDHLHKGHQEFLKTALGQADFCWCGVAGSWTKKTKLFPQTIQSFQTRVFSLKEFLSQQKLLKKTNIFSLENPWEPAASSVFFDTIAATSETLAGAKLVNKKRKINQLKPLKILNCDLIPAADQQKISSTRIRLGEIDRQGTVYQQMFLAKKTLYLPQSQRHQFKKPVGQLLNGAKTNSRWLSLKIKDILTKNTYPLVITVGDISTLTLQQDRLPINLAIFDLLCQRQPISFNLHRRLKSQADFAYKVKNNPGTISAESISLFKKVFAKIITGRQKGIIQVKGEEDLLTLLTILFAPLGSLIFYGQPYQGLVKIKVTEKIKAKTYSLLAKFQPGF